MPSVNRKLTVAAGGFVENVMSGSQFEYMPFPAVLTIAAVTDIVAAPVPNLDITFGNAVIVQQGDISGEAVAGGGPRFNEDVVAKDAASAGDRIIVRLNNPNVGAADVNIKIKIDRAG